MDNWRKSSYSGPDDGNACVEIATTPTHIAIRDSKAPATAHLTFPADAFAVFLAALKERHPQP
jgi:predicted hotdog family 3-hydroxylacyl-ACP dehydratase